MVLLIFIGFMGLSIGNMMGRDVGFDVGGAFVVVLSPKSGETVIDVMESSPGKK